MANQNLLTGAVMLETMWKTRHQDLLDLIAPFVFYAVAKVCSPKEYIDNNRVLDILRGGKSAILTCLQLLLSECSKEIQSSFKKNTDSSD